MSTPAEDAIRAIEASFNRLRATIADLEPAALATPNVVGHWSPKDVIAHVAYWSDLDARQIEAEAQGLPEPGAGDDWQVVNEREYLLRRDWSAAQALAALDTAHARMMAALMPRADLTVERVRGIWEHYDEHAAQLAAWRASLAP